jgi:phage repressor protein C with HTH and peptisase S24 domain
VTGAVIGDYERGRTKIKSTTLGRLRAVLGPFDDVGRIFGAPKELTPEPGKLPNVGQLVPGAVGKVKIYGGVSAGEGNTSTIDSNEIEVPLELCRPDFGALIIEGDSMMDFLHPSDVAIFKDWRSEKLNHIVAAELPDKSWVVKLMVYEEGAFRLRSINGAYKDIHPPFRIAGFLVGFVRDDGPERLIRLNPFGLKP